MLTINVGEQELWDPIGDKFIDTKPITVQMEHSLISMSKWEAIWEKPLLQVEGLAEGVSTAEEELSYIKCMIIGKVPDYIPPLLQQRHGREIRKYMDSPNTATQIYTYGREHGRRTIVTTELIYYWMIRFNIPMECEKWHINRLLTLVRICNIKEKEAAGKGKLTMAETAKYQHELNKARRAK